MDWFQEIRLFSLGAATVIDAALLLTLLDEHLDLRNGERSVAIRVASHPAVSTRTELLQSQHPSRRLLLRLRSNLLLRR